MITHIGSKSDADRAVAELEDAWNVMHHHSAASWALDKAGKHWEASVRFHEVQSAMRHIRCLNDELINWQERNTDEARATWLDEHDPEECDEDPDCTRDHGAELAESAAETRWEIERDDAA